MKGFMKDVVIGVLIGSALYFTYKAFTSYRAESKPEHIAITIRKNILYVKSPTMRASAVYFHDNLVLTARHVCEAINEAYLVDFSKKTYRILKVFMAKEPEVDMCLMIVESWDPKQPIKLPGVTIPGGYNNEVGERMFIAGYSGGLYYSFRTGTVWSNQLVTVADGKSAEGSLFVENLVDVLIEPGGSGGGGFNMNGELVGIASVGSASGGGLVPLNQINAFLKTLKLPKAGE